MSEPPWLWLLAGPNGAGKSTFAPALAATLADVVGPDTVAYQLSPSAPEEAALEAGRRAVARIHELLRARQSFAIETTLSGRLHLRIARQAKLEGWNVGMVYIGLGSAELAIERVRQRTLEGGHNVAPRDVRRRYDRSLRSLAIVCGFADLVQVRDNSGVRRRMRLVLEVRRRVIVFRQRRAPKWVRPTVAALEGGAS